VGHETDATLGNSAGVDGGGIYCAEDVTLTDAKVYHNSAGGNGGGICVADKKKVTLAGTCQVDGNSAGNKGGGVYINTGEITTASATTVTFNNNHAANGGGLYLKSATAILTNAQFTNNKALGFGGGIYSNHTKLDLNSENSFDGNMAGTDKDGNAVDGHEGSGGGIWFGGENYTLTLNAVEMKNNSAYRGANTTNHGNGGALYVASSSLQLNGAVKIHDNHADSAFGGGICLSESSLAVTVVNDVSPHIYSNSALSGGGICVANAQAVDWSNLSITVGGETAAEGNTADSGGGISAIGTSLTIGPNVIVRNNTADDGGGIYIKRSNGAEIPTLTIKPNTVISKNTAKTNGGGLYAYLANVEINENVSIIDNKTTSGHGGGLFVYRPHNAHTYNASTGAVTVTEV
jgi:predicted outer membrane repeat protein